MNASSMFGRTQVDLQGRVKHKRGLGKTCSCILRAAKAESTRFPDASRESKDL